MSLTPINMQTKTIGCISLNFVFILPGRSQLDWLYMKNAHA